MSRGRCLLASFASVLCLLGIAASSASAGQVVSGTFTQFNANPGETNVVTVDRIGDNYVFTDSGAPITPMALCVAGGNPNTAVCPASDVENLSVSLGDMNDSGAFGPGITGQNLQASISGGDGNDVLTAGPSIEATYIGDDGNDNLVGGPDRDRLIGNDGNDQLNGNGDGDSLEPGDGNDVANGGPGDGDNVSTDSSKPDGADVLSGGPGIFDSIDFRRNIAVSLTANGVADDGSGCPGSGCEGDNFAGDFERIDTGDGNDLVAAGPGDNEVFSGPGDDSVFGQGGNDDLLGDEGNDLLNGNAGNDRVSGGSGSDQQAGGTGDDVLDADTFGASEPDVFSGGKGLDQVDYSGASQDVKVDLNNQPDDGVAGEGDNVKSDVEDAIGGDGNDKLIGSARANEFEGGLGSDILVGRKGGDGLIGGSGSDKLIGGKAPDLLDGGAGPDRLSARDGGRDEARCGSAVDRLKADRFDRFGPDCDKVAVKGRRA